MLLAIKADKIFLHEKEEREEQRLNHVLMSQTVGFACQPCTRSQQATNELPSYKLAVDEWTRADGALNPRNQGITALVVGTYRGVTTTGPGSRISHPCDSERMALDPREKQQSCKCYLGKDVLLALRQFLVLQPTCKCSFIFVFF